MLIAGFAAMSLWLDVQDATLPRPAFSQELRTTDCTSADQRRRLLDQGEAALEAARPAIEEANTRLEARLNAHGDRLIASRVWTATDRDRFNRELLERPDFRAYLNDQASLIGAMFDAIETIMREPVDEVRNCRAMVAMIGHLDRGVAIGEQGWALADRAYAEEARRLGVSLD